MTQQLTPIKLDDELNDTEMYQCLLQARQSERLQLLELLETHLNNLHLRHPVGDAVMADLNAWISERRNINPINQEGIK